MTYTPEQIATAYLANDRNQSKTAIAVGCSRETVQRLLKLAAPQGLVGTDPVMPGYRITSTTVTPNGGKFIQQKPERGDQWEVPEGHSIKGVSALVDADGRIIQQWQKTDRATEDALASMRIALDAFKEELPRVKPTAGPANLREDLLNQFTVTDNHFGMLAWAEETGADYDLKTAERLLVDWFSASIAGAPDAHTAVFAQLGDLMHHDALESVTPAHRHVLDADSRLQKVIRIVIRCVRQIIGMLLQKHAHVHVVMAEGNHDPASSAWLREMLASMYEDEPRITIDTSPVPYYAYEWGQTALFYHHGHKRGVSNVDVVFAGMFREMFGRCTVAYAHTGHKHNDEGKKTGLMYVEQHETLAARDAFAAHGGWMSGRSAKRITYSKSYGEVDRSTLRPAMVAGASRLPPAANDNGKMEKVA